MPVITWDSGHWKLVAPRPGVPRTLHTRPCFACSARPAGGELLLTPVPQHPQHPQPGTSLRPGGRGCREPRVGVRFEVSVVAVPADPAQAASGICGLGFCEAPGDMCVTQPSREGCSDAACGRPPFPLEPPCPRAWACCRPGVGAESGLGPGPLSGRLDTCRRAGSCRQWVAGCRLTALCPRPHVCAERELSLVGRRQPCVRAFSRVVPVWTPGCRRQAWCFGRERRYVGPWERGALQH